jgi:outer membrane protein assembly factor BamB
MTQSVPTDPASSLRRSRPALAALTLALAGALLSACASQGGAKGSGSSASATPAPKPGATGDRYEAMASLGYKPQWNAFAVVPRGNKISFFDAYDDILVAHETGNSITVMESSTGAARWSLDLAESLVKFVGNIRDSRNGNIIASSQGELFLLDARTGVINDRQKMSVIVNTPPVQFGSMLVYGCPNGEAQGHNLTSGYRQWGNKLSGSIEADPVRLGNTVAVVSQRGDVAILDPITGSSFGRARIFGALRNNPVATDTTLFIAGVDQSVWAFGPSAGSPLWRARTEHELTGQPAYFNNAVFVPIPVEGLTAFSADSGDRLWSNGEINGEVIAARAGRLIVQIKDGAMLVDPISGEILETVTLRGLSMIVTDQFADGNLYLVEPGGRIQKFSPR